MIELFDISLREYFELENIKEYNYAIRFAYSFNKSVDHFNIGDMMEKPFGLIKDLQFDIQNNLTWEQFVKYISMLSGLSEKEIAEKKLLTVCQTRAFILSEIENITKVEEISLSHDVDNDEQEAGIGLFDGLGIELQIRALTGGDITKKELIRQTKYQDCFVELVIQKRMSEYQTNLNIIKKRNLQN